MSIHANMSASKARVKSGPIPSAGRMPYFCAAPPAILGRSNRPHRINRADLIAADRICRPPITKKYQRIIWRYIPIAQADGRGFFQPCGMMPYANTD
jgi:hypothetical protein